MESGSACNEMSLIEKLLEKRARLLGPNVPTFYDPPVHIVKGEGVWLWDATGKRYLDCYNNVPHVGHCHPAVVEAITRQASILNTHTRYLHEGLLEYIERLTSLFDDALDTSLLTCSGSEANDVALRMAQSASGNTGIIATNNTYHGNTALVSQIGSRYPPIGGRLSGIRLVNSPVGSKTVYNQPEKNGRQIFTENVIQAIENLDEDGQGCAALIICPYFANEGFPCLERGFLDETINIVHNAGGLVIADEVQPGFGRLGSHWWGHQRLGFKPDIVTLGKPMANGHPVAAVVTSIEVMSIFRKAYRYFNTFGGNPVSVAAADATLTVIESNDLISNAHQVGYYGLCGLETLCDNYPCLAAARGSGLFFGAEICDENRQPDMLLARKITNQMKNRGVLLNTTGRHGTILKIRPPLPISKIEIDLMLNTLEDTLRSLT